MFGSVGAYIDDLTSAGDIKAIIDGLVKAGKLSHEAADELLKGWKD